MLLLVVVVQVPLVVISDHEPSQEDFQHQGTDDYFYINITQVEQALSHLVDESQEALVINAHHHLHTHKQLAAALRKAMRTHSEAIVDPPHGHDFQGADLGMHMSSQTYIDADTLLDEFELAEDVLTLGLMGEHMLINLDATPVPAMHAAGLTSCPNSTMDAANDVITYLMCKVDVTAV